MKFTSTITFFLVAGAFAAPNPQTNGCARRRPGAYCKRASDVLLESVKDAKHLQKRDPATENAAIAAAHEAINDLANIVALTTQDPEAYIKSLDLPSAVTDDEQQKKLERRGRASNTCGRKSLCWKRDLEQASTDDKKHCSIIEGACSFVKRAAEMVLQTAESTARAEAGTCGRTGGCFRMKRDLLAIRSLADEIAAAF